MSLRNAFTGYLLIHGFAVYGQAGLSLTMRDVLTTDTAPVGTVSPGDGLEYQVAITNGDTTATAPRFTMTLDPFTTLSGQIRSTPLALPDFLATDEDTSVFAAAPGLIQNDFLLPTTSSLIMTAVWTTSTLGTVSSFAADGSLTYNPNGQFEFLGQGEQATDVFHYTASDSFGNSDETTATVAITGVNDPPVAINDNAATDEDHFLSIPVADLLLNDIDPDFSDTKTVTNVSSPSTGTVDLLAGTITYDPVSAFNFLAQGQTGSATFDYTIQDALGASDTGSVSVSVTGVNDPPEPRGDTVTTDEDHAVTVTIASLLLNDTDPDSGDSVAFNDVSTGTLAGVERVGNDLVCDPGNLYNYLNPGETAHGTVPYSIHDLLGATTTSTVDVVIEGVNDAPVAQPDTGNTSEDGGPVTGNVLTNDIDPDTGDVLAVITTGPVTGLYGELSLLASGSYTYTIDNTLTAVQSLKQGEIITDNFEYKMQDSHNAASTSTLTISITGTNDLPVLNPGADLEFETFANTTLRVGAAGSGGPSVFVNVALADYFTDVDGDPLEIQYPAWPAGSLRETFANGTFVYTPTAGAAGIQTLPCQVSDGNSTMDFAVKVSLARRIWYVNENAPFGGLGRSADPFRTTALAVTASAPGDIIYLYWAPTGNGGTYQAPVLKNDQWLIGAGVELSVPVGLNGNPSPTSLIPAGSKARLSGRPGPGLVLAQNNVVRGLEIYRSDATSVFGSNIGTLVMDNVAIDQDLFPAFDLSNGTAEITIERIGGPSARLNNINGNVTINTVPGGPGGSLGSIFGAPSGPTMEITGGSANVTLQIALGAVDNNTRSLHIAGHTGGIIQLNGFILERQGGILLENNFGTVISFNGFVDASTVGSNIAFSATGGGTVTIGSNSVLQSQSATALNVSNTTIGSPFSFRSINAGNNVGAPPPVNGIVLNNTGTEGRLLVSGQSFLANSGGTIQNTTGDAISLTNTINPSLSRMRVMNNSGNGLFMTNVSGLTLNECNFTNNADNPTNESNLKMQNLSGENTVMSCTFSQAIGNNVVWAPASGTATLNWRGCVVGPANPGELGSGLLVNPTGTANATLNVQGGTFTGNNGDSLKVAVAGSATANVAVPGEVFFLDSFGGINFTVDGNADLTFNVNRTTFLRNVNQAIDVIVNDSATALSEVRGMISSNAIGDPNPDTGSREGQGIKAALQGAGRVILYLVSNDLSHTERQGILIQSTRPVGSPSGPNVDLTLRNNEVFEIDNNGATPVATQFGTQIEAGRSSTLRMDIGGNVSSSFGGVQGFRVTQQDTATFALERLTGSGTNAANVATFVAGQNFAGSTASAALTTGFTFIPDGTVLDPLLLAEGGIEADHSRTMNVPALSQAELDAVVNSAREYWKTSGLTEAQTKALHDIRFEVTDLHAGFLGEAEGHVIRLDDNAGGKGWFVSDHTTDKSIFCHGACTTHNYTTPDTAAAGRIDLLTTVMHEMGHVLGLPDTYDKRDQHNIMYGHLTAGERKLPAVGQATGFSPHSLQGIRHQSLPADVDVQMPDLPPGKTIKLFIGTKLSDTQPSDPNTVSNQGQLTAEPSISQTTDDPDTVDTDDPTLTQVFTNVCPVPSDDTVNATEDTAQDIPVLANDSDGNPGTVLTPSIVSMPSHGIATENLDGTIHYIPATNYAGDDSFTYTVTDGTCTTGPVTVSIVIADVNDCPIAEPDTATTDEDVAVGIDVLSNDLDIDTNTTLTPIIVTSPTQGTATVLSDRTISYSPSNNFFGTDQFSYKVTDGTCETSAVAVNVTVNAVLDAPTAVDDIYTVVSSNTLSISTPGILANDTNVEPFPMTAVSVIDLTSGSGVLTVSPDGSFTFVPAPGFVGPCGFFYSASVNGTESEPAWVQITVTEPCELTTQHPVGDCTILPDLGLSSFADPIVKPGKKTWLIKGRLTVKNSSDVTITSATAEVALLGTADCADQLESPTVLKIKKLVPGKLKKLKYKIKVPPNTDFVGKAVVAVVDRLNTLPECNENNNVIYSPIPPP